MAESEQNQIRRNVNNLHKQSYVTNRNSYTRDSTIRIEGLQIKKGEAIKVIEETEAITGLNTVLAVVDNVDSGTCDVTLDSKENAVKLLHGIEINDVEYNVSLIFSDTTVVSFMKLPSYIEDEDIISKLQAKGIKLVSPVYRRAIPGTQVADGTRFVKCVFPPGFVALPWTIGFKQGSTTKYYRVVHNNQTKVCSLCMSAEHVQRQCPHFICNRCGEQGHTKRRCHTKECIRCKEFPLNCRCCENDESDETSYDGRCHYDDHNGDRHGNGGIGNGYGRNGFGAPKSSEHGRRKEKEDQECDNCGKINCICSSCFACGRDKCICLCIKCGHFPCECNDNCMYCGNDPCICICQDCSNSPCECICQKCNTATCDCSNVNLDVDTEVTITAINVDEDTNNDKNNDKDTFVKANEMLVEAVVHTENISSVDRKRKLSDSNETETLVVENREVAGDVIECITSVDEVVNEKERGEKKEKKARKDNINEISLDNSDEDDSTSSGDNIITTGGDIEKSLDPHEIVMNEKSPLKVIKKGNIGNKAVDGETTTGDEMDIDDSLVLDIQEDMKEGSKNISGTLSIQNTNINLSNKQIRKNKKKERRAERRSSIKVIPNVNVNRSKQSLNEK